MLLISELEQKTVTRRCLIIAEEGSFGQLQILRR